MEKLVYGGGVPFTIQQGAQVFNLVGVASITKITN